MTTLVEQITAEIARHGGSWIDNGKRNKCHCSCGYRPSLGEYHGKHVAEQIAAELQLTEDWGRLSRDGRTHMRRWVSAWSAVEEKP